jgi:periplasmic nitrate reductase NapD
VNISGVLVQTLLHNSASLQSRLATLPGVEVHAISAEGSLVVTIEQASSRAMADTLSHIQGLPDVLSATLIYHHHDTCSNEETAA